ncbi:hypothetical protein [Nonomuraea helvata]|uniref:LPXTG cell wall anchor domain-containing protein n=1 Tax=Nonomuraea helvata TaxID=37484 RepID=A0ABV5RUA6_9ACTN
MARARLAAAVPIFVAAFAVGGVSLAAPPAYASTGPDLPVELPTCLLPLPLLCDEQHEPAPEESWSPPPSVEPGPEDTWPGPDEREEEPWRPAGEDEHRVPRGHPETGGGGLAPDDPVWPFALGGVALMTGAGLAGFAVRRRKGVV